MAPIKTFACAFLGHWWELMGCAAFTLLGIYIAQSGRSNTWLVSASAILAVFFLIVAAYRTWKSEYDARLEAAGKLDAKADIRGTTWATILQYNPLADQTKDGSGLRFKCQCANYGQKPCEISRVSLVVSGIDFTEPLRIEQPLPLSCVTMVGPGEQFLCSGVFTVHGVKLSQLSRSDITIRLIDSLGTEYPNTETKIVWGKEFERL